MANMKDVTTLINQTVFLKVILGVPGNSKKVSGADVLETDADKGLLRVSKQLLNSKQLDAIKRSDFQTRAYLYNVCHKFADGVSLLPLALVEQVDGKLEAYASERAAMVNEFMGTYPQLCEDASKHLGSLYDSKDYPSEARMREGFRFTWETFSFEVPEQLKGMNAVLYEKAKATLNQTMKDAAARVESIMLADLGELVSHLYDKLTPGDDGKPRILRETAVSNLREWLELFPKKNVTNFAELSGVVAELDAIMTGVSGDKLRNSDLYREQIRAKMTGVKAQLSTMVVEKPGRIFRDE